MTMSTSGQEKRARAYEGLQGLTQSRGSGSGYEGVPEGAIGFTGDKGFGGFELYDITPKEKEKKPAPTKTINPETGLETVNGILWGNEAYRGKVWDKGAQAWRDPAAGETGLYWDPQLQTWQGGKAVAVGGDSGGGGGETDTPESLFGEGAEGYRKAGDIVTTGLSGLKEETDRMMMRDALLRGATEYSTAYINQMSPFLEQNVAEGRQELGKQYAQGQKTGGRGWGSTLQDIAAGEYEAQAQAARSQLQADAMNKAMDFLIQTRGQDIQKYGLDQELYGMMGDTGFKSAAGLTDVAKGLGNYLNEAERIDLQRWLGEEDIRIQEEVLSLDNKKFEETIRQFDITTAEGMRQFDQTLKEQVRQFDKGHELDVEKLIIMRDELTLKRDMFEHSVDREATEDMLGLIDSLIGAAGTVGGGLATR